MPKWFQRKTLTSSVSDAIREYAAQFPVLLSARVSTYSEAPRTFSLRSLMTSTTEKDFTEYGGNKEAARKVGNLIAERAKAKGIEAVVFDRGGYVYHGRVKELAEGAREGGLKF